MKKTAFLTFSRILSVFLCALFCFYAFPAAALTTLPAGSTDAQGEIAPLGTSTVDTATEEESLAEEASLEIGISEILSLRDARTKHFRLEDGRYAAVSYSTPVHRQDENGLWQEIDNRLEAAGDAFATPDARISFAKKITGNGKLFTLSEGNCKISFSLSGATKKTEGQVLSEDRTPQGGTLLQKKATLQNLRSRILYEEILPGVDLEYTVTPAAVKENILLKTPEAGNCFTFHLDLNNLSPIETEAGGIDLLDREGRVLFSIPAGRMWDAAGAESFGVEYTLTPEGASGKYLFTVTADPSFLSDPARVYPITVDPPVIAEMEETVDTAVTEANLYRNYRLSDTLPLGQGTYIYYKAPTLPELPAGALLTEAFFSLHQYESTYENTYVECGVYPVTAEWAEDFVWREWELFGNGQWGANYLHRLLLKAEEENIWYDFNVTPLVKGWYEGSPNYGLTLRLEEETATGTFSFDATEYGETVPTLTVYYLSALGVEDRYSYTSQSVGPFAGSVNLATGSLFGSMTLPGAEEEIFGYAPTLFYHTEKRSEYSGEYSKTGYGWWPDAAQQIRQTTLNDVTCYIYTDADGTDHYLLPKEGTIRKYEDEENLGLLLEVRDSQYFLFDANGTRYTFKNVSSTEDGPTYLAFIDDANDNYLEYVRNTRGLLQETALKRNGIGTIQTIARFTYGTGLSLTQVDIFAPDGETVSYRVRLSYSSTPTADVADDLGYLTRIAVYAVSGTVETPVSDTRLLYTAESGNEKGRLMMVNETVSGRRLTYTYENGKVVSILESFTNFSGTGTLGQKITLSYDTGSTTVRSAGSDDVHGNEDDLLTTYVFDHAGRVASIHTTNASRRELYGAAQGTHSDEKENKDALTSQIVTSHQPVNYLGDGSFETEGDTSWSTDGISQIQAESSLSATGRRHLKMTLPGSGVQGRSATQLVYLPAGTYTLSGRVRLEHCAGVSDLEAFLKVEFSESEYYSTEILTENTTSLAMGDYLRISVTFTLSSGADAWVGLYFRRTQAGAAPDSANPPTAYFDDISLVPSAGAGGTSLLSNGTMEQGANGTLTHWKGYSEGSVPTGAAEEDEDFFGEQMLALSGEEDDSLARNTLSVSLPYAQWSRSPLLLSGFVYGANSACNLPGMETRTEEEDAYGDLVETVVSTESNTTFGIGAEVTYRTTSDDTEYLILYDFPANWQCRDWQYVAGYIYLTPDILREQKSSLREKTDAELYAIIETLAIVKISVVCEYRFNNGTAYFDNIALTQDEGSLTRYSYDEEGNPTTVYQIRGESGYEYQPEAPEDRRPILYTAEDGSYVEYEYQHSTQERDWALKSETYYTKNGVKLYTQTYTQNYIGKVTESRLTAGTSSASPLYIETEKAYRELVTDAPSAPFGAVLSETDDCGNTTYYYYNEKGFLAAVIGPDGNGVSYTYAPDGSMASVQPATESATGFTSHSSSQISYDYNSRKQLEKITTPTEQYFFSYDEYGRMLFVKQGDTVLATYEYRAANGKLLSMTYATGFRVDYTYDALDNISEIRYNRSTTPTYSFSYANGLLSRSVDHEKSRQYRYTYDAKGNLTRILCSTTTDVALYALEYAYDEWDTPIQCNYAFFDEGGVWFEVLAVYSEENREELASYITKYGNQTLATVSYSYDQLKRITEKETQGGNIRRTETFSFQTVEGARTSTKVSGYTVTVRNTSTNAQTLGISYAYTYNANGYITQVVETEGANTYVTSYLYDALGRLVRENNQRQGYTYLYGYDAGHNILWEERYSYTTGSVDPDLCMHRVDNIYEGDTLVHRNVTVGWVLMEEESFSPTYDALGNPLSWYSGGTLLLSWAQGRKLTSVGDAMGLCTYQYGYNSDGVRISKNMVDWQETHEYVVNGTTILRETVFTPLGSYTLYYHYDEVGAISHVTVMSGTASATYYYVKNLQGDVVAVVNEAGAVLVRYTYDTWGMTYESTAAGISGLDYFIAHNNPFRYRGYYYDTETGFYYLNSRYYDPEVGRFLSIDDPGYLGITGDFSSYNLYAYCGNNPILRQDDGGEFWHLIIGAVVGAIIGGVSAALSGGDVADVVVSAIGGAFGGALAASSIGIVGQVIGSATISMASNATKQIIDILDEDDSKTEFDVGDMFLEGAVNGLCAGIAGNGASHGNKAGINASWRQLTKKGLGDRNARSYFVKTAHNSNHEFVLTSLFKSLGISTIGSVALQSFNAIKGSLFHGN